MRVRLHGLLSVGCLTVLLAGCDESKSSSPLSPDIAGPIAGVTIAAPTPIVPAAAAQIGVDQQPVTLTIGNASSTGVRPVTYTFEVASDTAFTSDLFNKAGVAQGDGGQTTMHVSSSLSPEHTYYWRTKADDGANASVYSAAMSFRVYTPVVIQAPALLTPADNATVTTLRPALTVTNAQRTGPAGAIQYLFEAATDAGFANKVVSTVVAEASAQTTYTFSTDLAYSTRYFWHVKAADPTHQGSFSSIQSFTTLAAPVVVVPSAPGQTPSGPVAGDAIDMSQATIVNSPSDLASWPVTTTLTHLDLAADGVYPTFSAQAYWPEVPIPGWNGGTLQFTLGMCLNIGNHWYCSAVVEFWKGLGGTGGPPSEYATNWFYDPIRWGPMAGHQPQPGEMIGFFVCAGDCRNNTSGSLSPARERSNVVLVPMPSGTGSFTLSQSLSKPSALIKH